MCVRERVSACALLSACLRVKSQGELEGEGEGEKDGEGEGGGNVSHALNIAMCVRRAYACVRGCVYVCVRSRVCTCASIET